MLTKVAIYQEDITVLNIPASDLGVFTFIEQILLDRSTETNTSTVGYVNTHSHQ